jgi:hypothetical protein
MTEYDLNPVEGLARHVRLLVPNRGEAIADRSGVNFVNGRFPDFQDYVQFERRKPALAFTVSLELCLYVSKASAAMRAKVTSAREASRARFPAPALDHGLGQVLPLQQRPADAPVRGKQSPPVLNPCHAACRGSYIGTPIAPNRACALKA